jgi:hypothetical protein
MIRARQLFASLSLGLLALAPTAGAAAPQVYATTDPGHSVAFAVEGGGASVLGLDADAYCGYVEPAENKKPRPLHLLAAPLAMRGGTSGLTAVEDESEMRYPGQLDVNAGFSGSDLVGDYRYLAAEPSFRCQTGTYYPGEATVSFEAVPFVRSGDPGAAAASTGETPIYFGSQGPLEVFIRREGKKLLVRGAVTSRCKFGGAHKSRRSPFFGIPYPLPVVFESFGGFFGNATRPTNGKRVKEVMRFSGSVGETAIDGIYSRRSVIGEGKSARRCKVGPIRFHADRYLPPAS